MTFYGDSYRDELFPGIELLRATREPCPVCGHPTGDCSDGAAPPNVVFGDAIEVPRVDDPMVLVEEDIRGEVQITPFTRARVLIAAKGSYIPASQARELGLL